MQIIFHYPQSEQGMKELQKKVAVAHAEILKYQIHSLPISASEKATLIDKVSHAITKSKVNAA